jgi:hypothetical protein
MDKRKVGPAGIIDLDDDAKSLFGLMALHVVINDPSHSPLLQVEPEERDDRLSEILFEKLSAADEIIRYLITHIQILDLDIIPLFLFKEVMKEAERLYDAVVDEANKNRVTIRSRAADWIKRTTLSIYDNMMMKDFRFIKRDHLDNDDIKYELSYSNEKRDFVTCIVDIYFKTMNIKALPKSKMDKLMSYII